MKHDSDDSDDGGYTKNKTKKGDAAYAAFLASKDPASAAYLESEVNQSDNRAKHIDLENDKKPAAKVSFLGNRLTVHFG